MPLSESDTRAKLIDPAIHARGWTEDLIRREETAGAAEIVEGQARKRSQGRTDYILRIKITSEAQSAAVALIEAKAENLPAIVTRETWELAQARRTDNSQIVKRKMKREYLLRSLIYCGCERRMAGDQPDLITITIFHAVTLITSLLETNLATSHWSKVN